MANNPITVPLPADLPTDWVYGQTIGPMGTDVGLTQQHGYNYLMQQVNAAQKAATQIGEAFISIPNTDEVDPVGSAAAVQANLAAHIADKNNPHGVSPGQIGAAAASHTHDASQVVSGILSAARGGTGVGSIAELAALLKSNGIAGLQTGSYQGTGTYGMTNPTVFQFDSPKSLFFIGSYGEFGVSGGDYLPLAACPLDTWVRGFRLSSIQSGSASIIYTKLSADKKTLSVYATGSGTDQCNSEDTQYFWAAI